MKQKFWLFTFLMLFSLSAISQWDSLPVKTKMIYSFSRGKVIGNNDQYQDVDSLYYTKPIVITIDSVLNLVGQNRKLIILSECLDNLVLNINSPIYNKVIKHLPEDYDNIDNILGNPNLNNNPNFISSSSQITAVYQFYKAIYFLTLPRDFLNQIRRNSLLTKEIDKKLAETTDDTTNKYASDVFISVNNMTFPLHMILLNKRIKDDGLKDGDNSDYNFMFHYEDSEQGSPFEENTNKLKQQRLFMNDAEEYVTNKGEPSKTIYLSPKYGIVRSYSSALDSRKRIRYVNILNLTKVELP